MIPDDMQVKINGVYISSRDDGLLLATTTRSLETKHSGFFRLDFLYLQKFLGKFIRIGGSV